MFAIGLLIIVLLLILVIACQFCLPEPQPRETLVSTISGLSSGDLIIVADESLLVSKLTKLVSRSSWSHTAMVWRRGEKTYIIETTHKTGARAREINDWLKCNAGAKLCVLKYSGNFPVELLEARWPVYAQIRYRFPGMTWLQYLYPLKRSNCCAHHMWRAKSHVCYEFNIHILQDLGVIQKRFWPGSFLPCNLVQHGILPHDCNPKLAVANYTFACSEGNNYSRARFLEVVSTTSFDSHTQR